MGRRGWTGGATASLFSARADLGRPVRTVCGDRTAQPQGRYSVVVANAGYFVQFPKQSSDAGKGFDPVVGGVLATIVSNDRSVNGERRPCVFPEAPCGPLSYEHIRGRVRGQGSCPPRRLCSRWHIGCGEMGSAVPGCFAVAAFVQCGESGSDNRRQRHRGTDNQGGDKE